MRLHGQSRTISPSEKVGCRGTGFRCPSVCNRPRAFGKSLGSATSCGEYSFHWSLWRIGSRAAGGAFFPCAWLFAGYPATGLTQGKQGSPGKCRTKAESRCRQQLAFPSGRTPTRLRLALHKKSVVIRTVTEFRSGDSHALALYDDNGNGRITCKEARRHGSRPCPEATRPTGTCGMATATEWSASDPCPAMPAAHRSEEAAQYMHANRHGKLVLVSSVATGPGAVPMPGVPGEIPPPGAGPSIHYQRPLRGRPRRGCATPQSCHWRL